MQNIILPAFRIFIESQGHSHFTCYHQPIYTNARYRGALSGGAPFPMIGGGRTAVNHTTSSAMQGRSSTSITATRQLCPAADTACVLQRKGAGLAADAYQIPDALPGKRSATPTCGRAGTLPSSTWLHTTRNPETVNSTKPTAINVNANTMHHLYRRPRLQYQPRLRLHAHSTGESMCGLAAAFVR
jgi:hypothetical protein